MVEVPDETAEYAPEEVTVATDVLALLQVPPVADALRAVTEPLHAVNTPVIEGCALTVRLMVLRQLPIV